MNKCKGFKVEVTVYYAIITGEFGCSHHSFTHRTVVSSSDDAVIEAMICVKKKEARLYGYGKNLYWRHADWHVPNGGPDESGHEKLTIFNKKGIENVIRKTEN